MSFLVRRVDDQFGIWNPFDSEFVNPRYLSLSEKEIINYLSQNPFPIDPDYSIQDLIRDLTRFSGSLIISCRNIETAEFIAKMLYELI